MTENKKDKTAAIRVKRAEQRKRDLGRVQRKRWAHPDDWPEIDKFIEAANKKRES